MAKAGRVAVVAAKMAKKLYGGDLKERVGEGTLHFADLLELRRNITRSSRIVRATMVHPTVRVH